VRDAARELFVSATCMNYLFTCLTLPHAHFARACTTKTQKGHHKQYSWPIGTSHRLPAVVDVVRRVTLAGPVAAMTKIKATGLVASETLWRHPSLISIVVGASYSRLLALQRPNNRFESSSHACLKYEAAALSKTVCRPPPVGFLTRQIALHYL
jgi:hypothetical protein